jgi:WD40 repeat protein
MFRESYKNTNQEINLEQHTKLYFDQFIRKKTVYCHINTNVVLTPGDDPDDIIDEANVYNVVYSGQNDESVVSAASDGLVKVFSRSTGILKKTLKGHLMEINILCKSVRSKKSGMVYTTAEKYLISGSENGYVKIWDTKDYNCLATIREFEQQEITSLIFWEGEEIDRGFLMICSPTKGVCIYQEKDLVFNQGLAVVNQKYHNITEMYQDKN